MYSCDISIELLGSSDIQIGINNEVLFEGSIIGSKTFYFTKELSIDSYKLWINNYKESAVEIMSIGFDNISTDRLRWEGVYYPTYPASYFVEELQKNNHLSKKIKGQTHMSWKGKWELEFTTPIFTWIHKIENLGWIYN